MGSDERRQLEQDVGVAAELELEDGELLAHGELELEQTRYGPLSKGLEREIGERLPSNAGQLRPQSSGTVGVALARAIEGVLEPERVDLLRAHREDVSARLRSDRVAPERPAELGDVVLERMPRSLRRTLSPDVLHEPVGGDRLTRAQRKDGEQRALLSTANVEDAISVTNLERPEELDLQHGAFVHRGRPANNLAAGAVHTR
jgi:hypothetical protein